jgi:hypothetical protein
VRSGAAEPPGATASGAVRADHTAGEDVVGLAVPVQRLVVGCADVDGGGHADPGRPAGRTRPLLPRVPERLGGGGKEPAFHRPTKLTSFRPAHSKTITAMRREGLVETSTGSDARTRTVALTDRGRALVPFLDAEWRATERAWAELEAELPYALTQVVDDITAALQRRSFLDRITHQLDRPPDGADEPRRASGDQRGREHRT